MGSFVRALVDCTAKLGLSPKASTGTEQAFRRPIQRVLRLVACHFVFYHGTHRTHRKGCLAPMWIPNGRDLGTLRKNPQNTRVCGFWFGADFLLSTPARTRTLDPLIKSQLLYRLSYKGNCMPWGS